MLDKTESVITKNTTSALSHLAFCALVALGLARQDGIASTPYAENLFLISWLATAQKQRRLPKSVAADIIWLLERRPVGAKLRFDDIWLRPTKPNRIPYTFPNKTRCQNPVNF